MNSLILFTKQTNYGQVHFRGNLLFCTPAFRSFRPHDIGDLFFSDAHCHLDAATLCVKRKKIGMCSRLAGAPVISVRVCCPAGPGALCAFGRCPQRAEAQRCAAYVTAWSLSAMEGTQGLVLMVQTHFLLPVRYFRAYPVNHT